MTFESAYTALLSGDSTTVITGNSLTLSSSRCVDVYPLKDKGPSEKSLGPFLCTAENLAERLVDERRKHFADVGAHSASAGSSAPSPAAPPDRRGRSIRTRRPSRTRPRCSCRWRRSDRRSRSRVRSRARSSNAACRPDWSTSASPRAATGCATPSIEPPRRIASRNRA